MNVQSLRVADNVIDSVWTILDRMGWGYQSVYVPCYNSWTTYVDIPTEDELLLFSNIFGDTLVGVVDWVL